MDYAMQEFWNYNLSKINERINKYFINYDDTLVKSMSYSVCAPGKRLRPILASATAAALGRDPELVVDFGLCIEFIHAFSLIHDDLPGMDNSDLRRGLLTNHKKFGEGIAILAGDALLSEAFHVLSSLNFPAENLINVIKIVSKEVGFNGLCGGQLLDLEMNGKVLDKGGLKKISILKTSSLMRAAVVGAAVLLNAEENQIDALSSYALNIGVAFQMVDDILDLCGDKNKIGKDVGLDSANDKNTFPKVLGIEETRNEILKHFENAIQALDVFGIRGGYLKGIAKLIVERNK